MREWLGWTLTAALLPSCGGMSALSSSKDASTAIDSESEKDVTVMGASVVPGPGDSLAQATDRCGNACPALEPTVGDSCDFALWCEYGGSPLVPCNRVYDCFSGHVVVDRTFISDASTCSTVLLPGCPASRATVVPGEACVGANPLQCVYATGECDCIQGYGTRATWVCSDPDAGDTGGCPVPRAMLGSPCSPDASGPDFCQNIATCALRGLFVMREPVGDILGPLREGHAARNRRRRLALCHGQEGDDALH
jgi:hypothetical protein